MTNLKLAFVLEAVDRATATVQKINTTVDKLNEPTRRVGASFKALLTEAGLPQLQKQIHVINEKAQALVGSVRNVALGFAAVTAAAGGVFFGLKRTIDEVDHAVDVSKKLGVSIEVYQRLGYAAQLNGSKQEEMGSALQFLSLHMVEATNGSKEAALWFSRVGIPLDALKRMNVVEVFEAIADKFEAVGNAGQNAEKKIAVMKGLMGRGGAELAQVLNLGSKGLKTFYQEADKLGAVVDGKTAEAMAGFNDNFDRLKFSIFGVVAAIARTALPALDAMVRRFTEMNVASRGEMGEKLGRMIADMVPRLPAFLTSIGQISGTLATIAVHADRAAQAMGGWERVLTAIAVVLGTAVMVQLVALLASIATGIGMAWKFAASLRFLLPVLQVVFWTAVSLGAGLVAAFGWWLLIVPAIAAAALAVVKYWTPVKTFFTELWEKITAVGRAAARWSPFGGAPDAAAPAATGGALTPRVAGALTSAPVGTLGAPGGRRLDLGGTLNIKIDTDGRARVQSVNANSKLFDFDVYSGWQMATP